MIELHPIAVDAIAGFIIIFLIIYGLLPCGRWLIIVPKESRRRSE